MLEQIKELTMRKLKVKKGKLLKYVRNLPRSC